MDNILDKLSFLNWPADDPRREKLARFLERVKSSPTALVSRSDRERLIERHLLPSLEPLDLLPETGTMLDVGSGGGFPAIPIALARPALDVTCVESNQRKSFFLRDVSRETSWLNLRVFTDRVEELHPENDGRYNVVTARAVADLPDLIPWTRRFLAPGGRWIFWKGQEWRKEGDLDRLRVRLEGERELSDGARLIILVPQTH
ncbi:MAG: 16S rRNA (guanine(527)-N(7))-methyltransferase RsmG [bacterium]|nr:16S rRNA (guanine(527)-N(7))-methyltransferase RsmG [bacterium]